MILTSITSILALKLPRHEEDGALFELMDRGSAEVVDGKWTDRFGYRQKMLENVKRDRTTAVDVEAAQRRSEKLCL